MNIAVFIECMAQYLKPQPLLVARCADGEKKKQNWLPVSPLVFTDTWRNFVASHAMLKWKPQSTKPCQTLALSIVHFGKPYWNHRKFSPT